MDKEIFDLIIKETKRQNEGIELIASENYASKDVREACGSILTNKYAEGYSGRRYYGGCEVIDEIEMIAIERACKLFGAKFANVQPHSGSQANAACYRALMPNGGKVLSLVLNEGGHLTHGSPVSFSSHLYEFIHYPLGHDGKIDYEMLDEIAKKERPNVILAGFSSYPYIIDFKRIREIADSIDALFMVDMAHIAGLVAAKLHPNPIEYADIVSSTTHKTLRGPRGGLILTNSEELAKKINQAVFPYYQGGPLEHIIAGKAICFKEAMKEDFIKYQESLVNNTKACQMELEKLGAITSQTENHLFLLNTLETFGLNGLEAQKKLEEIGITTNKNMLPNDKLTPKETSGLRIGFAAATTRGCTADDSIKIADVIYNYLKCNIESSDAKAIVSAIVSNWRKIEEI